MRRYLTPQLTAELVAIEERCDYLNGEVLLPIGKRGTSNVKIIESQFIGMDNLWRGDFQSKYGEQFLAIIQELSNYKERMENILCETDIKEQDHSPMDHSLWSIRYGRAIDSFLKCRSWGRTTCMFMNLC